MYPNIPYEGLTWPMTQHAGVISETVLKGLLEACSLCAGKEADAVIINNYLIQKGILTANIRADSQQPDAWRDYQQILSELGLIFSTAVSREIILTPVAIAFIEGSLSYEELLTLQLLKYQYPNGHKTQISPSLRESFPNDSFTYESVAHLQAMSNIRIRPAVIVWLVLSKLLEKGESPSITVDEMQSYLVRCTTNEDVDFCVQAIIDNRKAVKSLPPLPRARRNMQDWMKLLSNTPLFVLQQKKLVLSQYSIDNKVELINICDTLTNPESFWMPTASNYKWDWFATYGNIDLSIELIPNVSDELIKSTDVSGNEDDIQPVAGREVILQPFNEIQHSDTQRKSGNIVSIYNYQKTQNGRNLHNSMVNLIANKCVAKGAAVFSDPKTVDLFVHYKHLEFLVEVKSITPSNFISRLRYAIGQVNQYNYLLPQEQNTNRRLALAFTGEIPIGSWTIPFVTKYLSMDLLTLRSGILQVCSTNAVSNELFA